MYSEVQAALFPDEVRTLYDQFLKCRCSLTLETKARQELSRLVIEKDRTIETLKKRIFLLEEELKKA